MSRVSQMSLSEILKETDIIMRETDISFIHSDPEVIREFKSKFKNGTDSREEVKQFLIDNECKIPVEERNAKKEKLILLIVKNYKENIQIIENHLPILKQQFAKDNSQKNFTQLANIRIQLKQQQENLEKAIRIGKGMEQSITYYFYDNIEKRYRLMVIDSREYIDGKNISSSKERRRFDKIDLEFKEGNPNEELGFEFILQSMLLTDVSKAFPDLQFGSDIRTMVLENIALEQGIISKRDLDILRTIDEEHKEFIDNNVPYDKSSLTKVKLALREYIQYVDMDKLLLISAYRFNEALEKGNINEKMHIVVRDILYGILDNIKDDKVKFSGELQDKNTYEQIEVTYSLEDIKKCISQFTKDRYLSKSEIEEYKECVNNKEINLSGIPREYIDVIFNKRELEKNSILSANNLIYVAQKYNWEPYKIIELYESNIIPLDYIEELKERIDLSDSVSFEKLNEYYITIKEDAENEETLSKYENYIKLYKEIHIKDKAEEQIQENSSAVIEKLAETLDEEEYKETVKKYYTEGIITLDSIVEWSNEEFITELFNQGLITLDDMKQLVEKEKLQFNYLSKIYTQLANNHEMGYDERLNLIKAGFIKEEDIFDLYKRNLIFEEDLKNLAEEGIVRKKQMQRIINSRTMEELERNSSIRLTGLNSLTKKNNEIYSYGGCLGVGEGKTRPTGKFIIDPNAREEFIRLLQAYRANTDLNQESPFYNYEFYVIPDETGGLGLNSVVIAERYYEDKDTESKFAINNATYFFKYKDLMVLSNLKKSEMTKERENIVFTANHVIANEKREGSWAKSVISSIVKTMMSSDLKEYNKKNQKAIILHKLKEIYTPEEIKDILEMATAIDYGEYIGEVESTIERAPKKNSNHTGDNISDDSEER